jgi:hypothetical protein
MCALALAPNGSGASARPSAAGPGAHSSRRVMLPLFHEQAARQNAFAYSEVAKAEYLEEGSKGMASAHARVAERDGLHMREDEHRYS